MSDLAVALPADLPAAPGPRTMPLHEARRGRRGSILALEKSDSELERRLLEMGFVEGAEVEVLHEGPFGRDPLVVRLDDMRVALRRSEAALVLVGVIGDAP